MRLTVCRIPLAALSALCALCALLAWSSAAQAQTGAATPAPAAPKLPPKECLAALDRLSAGVARDESGPVLRTKGVRISAPIVVPDGVITDTKVTSATRIRMNIDRQGRVVPGSVKVQASEGDANLAKAIPQAAEATLRFEISAAATVPNEFAFTTVYVSCARP